MFEKKWGNSKCEMRNAKLGDAKVEFLKPNPNCAFRISHFEFRISPFLFSFQQDLDTIARIGKKPAGPFH